MATDVLDIHKVISIYVNRLSARNAKLYVMLTTVVRVIKYTSMYVYQ